MKRINRTEVNYLPLVYKKIYSKYLFSILFRKRISLSIDIYFFIIFSFLFIMQYRTKTFKSKITESVTRTKYLG